MFDIVTHNILTIISAIVTFSMSAILMMLTIPYTKEWTSFRKLRAYLAFTCALLSVANLARCAVQEQTSYFNPQSCCTLCISAYQAMLFTAGSLVFMQVSNLRRRVVLQAAVITTCAVVLLCTLFWFPKALPTVFWLCVAAYVFQISFYTMIFRKEYKRCLIRLEEFYDEEMSGRLHWVRRYFYGALFIGILALFFTVVPVPIEVYGVFVLVYTFFYVYVSGCVIDYRANAAFIVQAAEDSAIVEQVHVALSEAAEQADQPISEEKEQDLRKALSVWIAERHFTEKDANLDEVARQLGTSQRTLSAHFSRYEQTSFRAWRTKLRIEEACRMLREEDGLILKSLNELVGMGDYSYFFKQFKQATGLSPTEYRDKYYNQADMALSSSL